ncbi:hypothetical protein TNCV_1716891 [Trichonephila clavipes]|nr:hypothetical protein TNCV_1716891 [Trichonephila clavipes]
MNGVHLALRHEGQKVNRIVMTSERMANCPPVKEWSKSFGFDSSSSLVCSQLASLHKNNALREIKLMSPYLQGKSTTMSAIAHQTEKEWIPANEKNRQRMAQIHAEGAAEQHAARLEEAHLRAHHPCFTTSEGCQPEAAHLRQT